MIIREADIPYLLVLLHSLNILAVDVQEWHLLLVGGVAFVDVRPCYLYVRRVILVLAILQLCAALIQDRPLLRSSPRASPLWLLLQSRGEVALQLAGSLTYRGSLATLAHQGLLPTLNNVTIFTALVLL